MLAPDPHIRQIHAAELQGGDGAKLWAAVHDDEATADLWAQDGDRRNMARVPLDAAGWRALQVLAGEVA